MFSIETKKIKFGKIGSLSCSLCNLKGESPYQLFYEYSHTNTL